jgi:DNA-binding FadR family transcriptional regulator
MEIAKIERKTVVEHVMERMKELIANGHFKVGDKIPTEQVLAEMFGIARSSIREAIKIFHYLGVLESQTGRGTFVCDRGNISSEALTWSILLGETDIYELVQLREVLERAGLEKLSRDLAKDPALVTPVIDSLEREVENMREATTRQDMEAYIQADYDFHGNIIAHSGNSLFASIYHTLRAFMHEEIKRAQRGTKIDEFSFQFHRKIVNAIKSKNIEATVEILQEHIQDITKRLKKSFGQRAQVFPIDKNQN